MPARDLKRRTYGTFYIEKVIPFRFPTKAARLKFKERRQLGVVCVGCKTETVEFYDIISRNKKKCSTCPKVKKEVIDEQLATWEPPIYHREKGCKTCDGPLELKYHRECSKCRKDVKFWTTDKSNGNTAYYTTLPDEWVGLVI